MKNILACLIGTLLCLANQAASAQDWQWLKKIGMGDSYDQSSVEMAATDSDGNTSVAGWYFGTLVLGDKTYTGSGSSNSNYFIARFNASGEVLWSKTVTGTSSSVGVSGIYTDQDGNTYITGEIRVSTNYKDGTVNFGDGQSLTQSWRWEFSNFVCKYSPTGAVLMKKFYTGYSADPATAFQVSSHGYMLVKGTLLDVYNRDPSDYFGNDSLKCYNPSGQLVWKTSLKPKNTSSSATMRLLADDDKLWVAGEWDTSQQLSLSGQTYSIGENELFLAAYDPASGTMLALRPTKTRLSYTGSKLAVRNGQLYIFGSFQFLYRPSIMFGDLEVKSTKPDDTYYYGDEGYLAKLDIASGEYSWAKLMTNFNDEDYCINLSAQGNIYVGTGGEGLNGPRYVQKLSPSGTLLWKQSSNAFIHDHVYLGVDKSENVYAAGWASNGFQVHFGDLSFDFYNEVGLLAKIQNMKAALLGVSLSSGTLSPNFLPKTTQYTATVASSVSSITVTPTVQDAAAVVKVNDVVVNSGSASSPVTLQQGNNTIVVDVAASDGTTMKYTITVVRENSAPAITPVQRITVNEGDIVNFKLKATDADAGQKLTYSLVDSYSNASIDPVSGEFTWLTTEADGPFLYMIYARATDNGTPSKYSDVSIVVEVLEKNEAPVLLPIALGNSAISTCGHGFVFKAFAVDADLPAQDITYTLQGLVPDGAAINPVSGDFFWVPFGGQEGDHVIVVRATDSGSPELYHEQSVVLTVRPPESPTESGQWPDVIGYNEVVTLSIQPIAQVDGYTWTVPDGFEVVEGQGTASVQIKALSAAAQGNITVTTISACGAGNGLVKAISASKASATVILSDLERSFTGRPQSVTVTTEPANLAVDIYYNGVSVIPGSVGEYTVFAMVRDENYSGEATAKLEIVAAPGTVTAIGDAAVESDIMLFPNPTHGDAVLTFAKKYPADIVIVDAYGRTLQQATATGVYSVDLGDRSPGIYFIKVLFPGEQPVTLKLLKY